MTPPALPKWTDAQAVTTYLTSVLGAVVAVVGALHPGFSEPAVVQAVLPTVGVLVAGVAQLVNVVTHRSAHAAAVVANAPFPVPFLPPAAAAGTAIAQR